MEYILINLGLSEYEAKVYLAALESGVASAQVIAQKAKIKRTTAYAVLTNLMTKGYIHTSREKNKTRYHALAPRQLAERFAEYQRELAGALPALDAVYNTSQVKPKVVYYAGTDGVREVYEDIVREKPSVILEWAPDDVFRFFPEFPSGYLPQRQAYHGRIRRIAPKSARWVSHRSRDKEENVETLLLPSDLYNPEVGISIYGHKVAFFSYHDAMGLIIDHAPIADAIRQAYELAWFQAKAMVRG